MKENSKEKEKREKATPNNNLYNFTLSPYFVRKETGISISSPDAKAVRDWNSSFLSHEVRAKSKIVQIVVGSGLLSLLPLFPKPKY